MRVETSVAIEFAVSCRPLRKSKTSATAIRPINTGRLRMAFITARHSKLIDDDRADLVGDVLEAVHDFFQMIVNFRADDETKGIAGSVRLAVGHEQRLQPAVVHLVGLLLDGDDARGQSIELAGIAADRAQQ